MTTNRIFIIQKKLKEQKLGSVFITNQYNVTYLTGFAGLSANERESFLLITTKMAYLFTFPTYFGLYNKTNNNFQVICLTQYKRLSDHLNEYLSKGNINSICFESENLTVAELSNLQKKVKVKWQPVQNLVENERIMKDEAEVRLIRKAAQITDQAFDFIKSTISAKSGKDVTEKDLALELEFFLKKNAGDIAFPPIVAFNKSAAIPHYLPANDQMLTANSLILLDFGAKVRGYCADMTRVIFWGSPTKGQVKIYHTVLEAQAKSLDILKPGIITAQVDQVARNYISNQGFEPYPHGLGHGVGLAIHEAPRLKFNSSEELAENMVVTVEPGIYLDGECGVRIEDLVVLKRDGIEILSKSPKELTVL